MEIDAQINEAFDKISAVYPSLSRKQIEDSSLQELLGDASLQSCLGKTLPVVSETKESFSAKIKPYVDSSRTTEGTGRSFAHWPLIRMVEVFAKSEILRSGIILVDLPGGNDTNVARSNIAEKFQGKLSVTCVVANIKRASNDQLVREILNKADERNITLDGNFNSKRYCVIVTCIDQMPVDEYYSNHPEVKEGSREQLEREIEARIKQTVLQKELSDLSKSRRRR
jgi:hypothetical protein